MSIRNSLLFIIFFLPLRVARQVLEKNWITFHLDFCPARPLGGNSGQKYITFFAPQGRSTRILIRDSLHLFIFFFKPTVSIFLNPALHASKPGGSIFPKPATRASNPVGGLYLLRAGTPCGHAIKPGRSNFSKAGDSSRKTGEGGSSFSKDSTMRLKTGWALSFKKSLTFQ